MYAPYIWICTVMYTQVGYLFVSGTDFLGNGPEGPKYVREIMRKVEPYPLSLPTHNNIKLSFSHKCAAI